MRRASRGRFEVPGSERDVPGKAGFMAAAVVVVVLEFVPPFVWDCCCCDGCCCWGWEGGGCWVGGLSVGAFAVAGGVEMPFCMFSAAGDAMVKGGWVVVGSCYVDVVGAVRGRASVKLRRTRRLGVRMRLNLAGIWGELNVTTSASHIKVVKMRETYYAVLARP
jgi:hypothetical protein